MGLRRKIKDGELTFSEVDTIIWGKWKLYERNNKFSQWWKRRKKRLTKSKKKR